MDHTFFFCSSVSGHLDHFHLPTTVNNAARNMNTELLLIDTSVNLSAHIHRSGITDSYYNSTFIFFRNHDTT